MAILPIDGGRYGTKEMTAVFQDQAKINYQLEIERSASLAQAEIGLIPKAAAYDIASAARSKTITVKKINELEKKTDHDIAALVTALASACKKKSSRQWVHYGLTSNDLIDTSNSLQLRDSLDIIQRKVARLALVLSDHAKRFADLPAVGRTHGQHASIISFGLKFANWAHEMEKHFQRINEIKSRVLICKMLGVVGTGSLMGEKSLAVQKKASKKLNLVPAEVATQVIPRERYVEYVHCLSLVASTLEKIAVEIRNLQRTEIGEVSESFKKGQMGSSAVPVKRNPIKSERITSLSKLVRSQLSVAFENVPLWHERDLSNSANERFVIPMVSILTDEMLEEMLKIIPSLKVNKERIKNNLWMTRGQIFAEFLLDAMIKKGKSRLEAYKNIQRVAFSSAETNTDFLETASNDSYISATLSRNEIEKIFRPESHLGASQTIIKNVANSVKKSCR